jgi:cytochrome b subunit of formate dehydrogenase
MKSRKKDLNGMVTGKVFTLKTARTVAELGRELGLWVALLVVVVLAAVGAVMLAMVVLPLALVTVAVLAVVIQVRQILTRREFHLLLCLTLAMTIQAMK